MLVEGIPIIPLDPSGAAGPAVTTANQTLCPKYESELAQARSRHL